MFLILDSASDESVAESFFMIRVTTQLPCVVLHVAFIGGTPGDLRHKASLSIMASHIDHDL